MARTQHVLVRPRSTSWMSVIGGWIASIGMAALLAPLAAGAVATRGSDPNDVALAVPAVLAVLIAYLVGGYVAGRMAGYSTSWHGMLTAFFGLFIVLGAILVAVAADLGYLGDLRIAALPAWTGPAVIGDALTFGALLGFLAAIFAGWLGGLLAPTRLPVATAVTPVNEVHDARDTVVREETVVRDRPAVREPAPRRQGFRLFPSVGRKGGERIERSERVESDADRDQARAARVDRR